MHRFPALLYHHVGPSYPGANRALTISPEVFRRQMERLARWGYTGIRPADWIDRRESSVSSPSKPILITFDDAYEDLSRFALPVLAELGFSAGIYVATGQIGQTNAWDEQKGYGTLRVMTAEQIVYWSNQGFEFGAHSRSHPDLTTLPDDRLIAEVAGSKDDLSSLLGSAVRTFAYPYGAYNERVQATVRNYYELAFTIEEGSNWPNSDPHRLRRAFISPSASAFQFAVNARFGGGMKWWRDLRSLLAIRTRARRIAKAIFS